MIISQAKNLGIDPDIIKLMVGKSVRKDILTYMTGIDVKNAFKKLQEVSGISTFTEESENIVKTMETEKKRTQTSHSKASAGCSCIQKDKGDFDRKAQAIRSQIERAWRNLNVNRHYAEANSLYERQNWKTKAKVR